MILFTLLELFHLLPVIVSQAVYPQTPIIQTASVGSTCKMHCHTGWLTAGAVHWYKYQQGKHIQLVFTVIKLIRKTGRFSGEINEEETTYTLVIDDIQRNDSGIYYCAAKTFSGTPFIFGNGSELFILGSPTITLLHSPSDEIHSRQVIRLMCFVSSVPTDYLTIRWNVSSQNNEEWLDTEVIILDGVYSVSSQIRFKANKHSNWFECTCSIQINSAVNLISENYSHRTEPGRNICLFLLCGTSIIMILLLIVSTTYSRWSWTNQHTADRSKNYYLSDSRHRDKQKETLYADLAFTAEQTI
ncbi:lachesin-like isoform X1 [Chiloscyllium plagiosum]|uniref:lachesin-like isoform X1 n=1 Tax=Chiloscyllium plagiosum TaxID=36176 RepID=UPI001CB7D333|nr:lachesin-like isoform X1 [Chiloscyllium plagiosum]